MLCLINNFHDSASIGHYALCEGKYDLKRNSIQAFMGHMSHLYKSFDSKHYRTLETKRQIPSLPLSNLSVPLWTRPYSNGYQQFVVSEEMRKQTRWRKTVHKKSKRALWRLLKSQASSKRTPRKHGCSSTQNTTRQTLTIYWDGENRWSSSGWGQTTTDWPITCTRPSGLETLESVRVVKDRWMQPTFFKNASSSLQSVIDTGKQQRRSRKNSSATLRAYKRRLPSSKQLAWTSRGEREEEEEDFFGNMTKKMPKRDS